MGPGGALGPDACRRAGRVMPAMGDGLRDIARTSDTDRARKSMPPLRFGPPDEFLIADSPMDCRSCWGCVRICPARAIRVVDGRAQVIQERCVKCGACVAECGHSGHSVRDDVPRVRALLASGRPVVALLATEFIAAMHPLSPEEVERMLEAIGFYSVESVALGEEMVAAEYERMHAIPCATLRLRSTCPVAVDWVRRFHPSLVSALMPVVPPYIAQARLVRELYPEDVAIVYVSPCYARKDEIFEPGLDDAVDVAIDFLELGRLLSDSKPRPPMALLSEGAGMHRPTLLKDLSLTDGYPRQTLVSRNMTDSDVVKIRGLRAIDEFLQAVTHGEVAPMLVDMLSCEGCLDGPAVAPGMSVFAKRNIVAAEREAHSRVSVSGSKLLSYMPPVETGRSFKPKPTPSRKVSDEEIDAALAEGEFSSREDVLDCGACGYDSCIEHAVAVVLGDSTWEMCFPLQRKRMERANEALEQMATRDALTGLFNRRVFDERMSEEVARSARYGSGLALLMIDVDRFKGINDKFGHTAGDEVLYAVGQILTSEVRETDIAVRYGGDEFAVILPGIDKTAAYAVAEKLRSAISSLTFDMALDESSTDRELLRVTVSCGVAAVNGTPADPLAILEAADAALYHAKQSGRDRVMIAPDR